VKATATTAERRNKDRPWATVPKAVNKPAPAMARKVANDNSEWSEF
jgi:hypothetical protein